MLTAGREGPRTCALARTLNQCGDMRQIVVASTLVAVLAAGCGKTLIATGATFTMFGAVATAIPDHEEPARQCDPNGPCFGELDTNVDESKWLVTGLVLMGIGALIHSIEHAEKPPVQTAAVPSWEPTVNPPAETGEPTGRWREVPQVPDESQDP